MGCHMPERIDDNLKTDKAAQAKKRTVRLGAAALLAGAAFGGLQHIEAATATLPVIARLVAAIELTVQQSLDFGTLAMTVDRTGIARLDPGANQLFIDGSSGLSLAGGSPSAGRLKIRGSEFPVSISLESTQVRMTNGTGTVMVNNFNLVTQNGGDKITITPSAGTVSLSVPVGASINTKARQLTGTYVGTTRVFANYQ